MTNPPQGSDEPGAPQGAPAQPPYGQPYGPPQPGPGSEYGRPQQPYGPPHTRPPYASDPPGYPPPGYGHPGQPFGAPPGYGRPPGKSKAPLIAAVAGVLVLLVLGGVFLAFTLRSEVLDPRSVERDVEDQFEQREGVAIDLDCAGDMPVDIGATYECTGTTADNEDVRLQITVTDEEQAAYTWTER
jgi:hypothetical protein